MSNRRLAQLAALTLVGLFTTPLTALGQGSIFDRMRKKVEEAQKKIERVTQPRDQGGKERSEGHPLAPKIVFRRARLQAPQRPHRKAPRPPR